MDIGDRMKRYEAVASASLARRVPVIIRIDGRAFHTFTRRYGRGYNDEFVNNMMTMAMAVVDDMQGCSFCYGQSDEVSFLLTDYRTINTEAWFDYDVNKMVSISAAAASSALTMIVRDHVQFDSRCFSLPHDDVCNYFIWRQQDATRNAIQMAAREHYSHKELHLKNSSDLNEMLFQRGVNFDDFPARRKRGWCVLDKQIVEPPIFTQDRSFIERHVFVRED